MTVTPVGAVRVDLTPHRNSAAFLAAGEPPDDGFDGFGRAFPAEQLGAHALHLGLPNGCGHGAPDNVACEGQAIDLDEPLRAAGLRVVGAGSGGTVSEILTLEHDGATTPVRVRLSDFLSRRPAFDDTCFAHSPFLYDVGARPEPGAEPRLWQTEIPLDPPVRCARVTLPVNPDMHIVGLWLLPAGPERTERP
ncbi:hypothetical protein Shyhy01_38860 [Streptomyces hygroscopicus subsp. hygroscopicus]|uniref:hypothetical protein n=1 Tax=Streptomyces sp. KHY 26 TaxID=3097359 RepID=UPI0024A0F11E|nr:hypothetical protein [Streptomyces hygroscopicus]GLX50936.1 hypothetical protein Shyhy01_38860 [Streptomyces hygroscopicus subsp. hygroscopicus]